MRRRRADHCLLRASAALDAEFPEAAQKVLNEARELCPAHPELEEVSARLLASASPPEPRIQHGAMFWAALVAAWILTAVTLVL